MTDRSSTGPIARLAAASLRLMEPDGGLDAETDEFGDGLFVSGEECGGEASHAMREDEPAEAMRPGGVRRALKRAAPRKKAAAKRTAKKTSPRKKKAAVRKGASKPPISVSRPGSRSSDSTPPGTASFHAASSGSSTVESTPDTAAGREPSLRTTISAAGGSSGSVEGADLWPISAELKRLIVAQMTLLLGRSEDEKTRIAAARVLLAAAAYNTRQDGFATEADAEDRPVDLELLRQELLHEERYLEFLRHAAAAADGQSGAVCAEREPGPLAVCEASAIPRPGAD